MVASAALGFPVHQFSQTRDSVVDVYVFQAAQRTTSFLPDIVGSDDSISRIAIAVTTRPAIHRVPMCFGVGSPSQ